MDFGRGNFPLTEVQTFQLRACLPPGTPIDHLTRQEARDLLLLHEYEPRYLERATELQEALLRQYGLYQPGLTNGQAVFFIKELLKKIDSKKSTSADSSES